MKNLFKLIFTFTLLFASQEGFSDQSNLEKLYHVSLKKEFASLSTFKEKAQKRKTAYIISGVLAVILLFGFIFFFKLFGLFIALIMIGTGYWTLQNSGSVVGEYEKRFKRDIISPIAKLVAGFSYKEDSLSQKDLEASHIFAPEIKQFSSWDMYQNEDVKFSYIHVVFDTKENASLERIEANIFEGFFIMIDKTNHKEGILVSEVLRNKVADMDFAMSSFFAKGRRGGNVNGFDIYGDVSQEDIDKVSMLHDLKIAISYQKDKTIVAFYYPSNPLSVDIFKSFDLSQAQKYASTIKEIESLVVHIQ